MGKIRVLLADDHHLFREGLANILNTQPDFEVVGEAGDGLEALIKARQLGPDLILMDVTMPGCDGLEATQRIKQELGEVTIVMLTVRDENGSHAADQTRARRGHDRHAHRARRERKAL
jgi:two-component system nitrate/nitrite response regulator NarL